MYARMHARMYARMYVRMRAHMRACARDAHATRTHRSRSLPSCSRAVSCIMCVLSTERPGIPEERTGSDTSEEGLCQEGHGRQSDLILLDDELECNYTNSQVCLRKQAVRPAKPRSLLLKLALAGVSRRQAKGELHSAGARGCRAGVRAGARGCVAPSS